MTQPSVLSPNPESSAACIQVTDLTVDRSGRAICSMRTLTVRLQERIGITGANGSGKTTLLRVLAGLETSFSGTINLTIPVSRRVFVHQSPCLFHGTVIDNVEYGLKARSFTKPDRRDLAMVWLQRLGLAPLAHRSTHSLSGGEARRTALARACVLQPELLLLDEPLADLDAAGIDCVQESLNELPDSTILISSPTPLPQDLVENTINLNPAS